MEIDSLKHSTQHTEEVRDIIDRMPHRTGKIVTCFVCAFSLLLLLFGWVIEYPEMVSGPILITSRQAPVRLVSNVSGKLHLLKNNGDTLQENDIIGFIENPAKLHDILTVEKFLNESIPDTLMFMVALGRPPTPSSLGEVSTAYYSFCNALEKITLYHAEKPFEKKKNNLTSLLNSKKRLLELNRRQMATKKRSLDIARKNIHRDSLLFSLSTIAELDLDRSSINYLGLVESTQAMDKENASYQLQINDTQHQLHLLLVEQQEKEQQLEMDFITSYNNLINNISQWKQRYLFIAPIPGTLEYLNFLNENDFIVAGEKVFSVLPANNPLQGLAYLPPLGAGKVAIGQKVIIKLDNYPYIEYGSIDGEVKSISLLTTQMSEVSGERNIQNYLITIELPNNLTTNYGATFDFQYEINGVAEIITKHRRLLQRLFDNLRWKNRSK